MNRSLLVLALLIAVPESSLADEVDDGLQLIAQGLQKIRDARGASPPESNDPDGENQGEPANSEDGNSPKEEVPAYPPPVAKSYKVRADHPRLFWTDDSLERIAAAPAVWAEVQRAAGKMGADDRQASDRCLCSAAIWRVGVLKGAQAGFSPEPFRDRAVEALMLLCEKPINIAGNHYAYNHLHPVALGYDWLYEALTDEQRATVRGRIVEALTNAPKKELDLMWNGYNHDSGNGMTLALVIHGETEIDWVAKYWNENWWSTPRPEAKGVGGFYNREYERNWQRGGGTREGWPYFADQASLVITRAAWETATGDLASLAFPWFDHMPVLLLHESVQIPKVDAKGRASGWRPFALPVWEYGGEYWTQAGFAYILAAGTGNRNPSIAALSAWLLSRWGYGKSTSCEELIFRCLIGDPRVAPASPEEMGLPLDYTTEGTGYHFDRTDWSDDATRVFFGAGETLVRNEPRGDVMIWTKGLPLIAGRTAAYAHHYSGPERMNVILLRDSDGKTIKRLGGSTTPIRKKTCSFRQEGTTFIAELQGLYPGKATLLRRTWNWDRSANVVTLTDEIRCADGITPLIVWNTPLKPEIDEGVTFTNGRAKATMTFDRKPKEVVSRGGETEQLWAQVFDGSLFTPEHTDQLWLKSPLEKRILQGGFYAVYVVPPLDPSDKTYRLKMTIRIQ